MKRFILILLALLLAPPALAACASRSRFPANSIYLDSDTCLDSDADALIDLDVLPPVCSHLMASGRTGVAQNTTTGTIGTWNPILFAGTYTTLHTNINADFSKGFTSDLSFYYSPADNAAGSFICRYNLSAFTVANGPFTISLGYAAETGGRIEAGDQTGINNWSNSPANAYANASGMEYLTLANDSTIGLMVASFTATTTFTTYQYDLECKQVSTEAAPCR